MPLTGKKILVTGADGFIGSHLTEALVRQGAQVRAFVWYNSFNSWGWLDQAPKDIRQQLDVVAGDIRDPHGVHAAMQGCEVVFHLAALIAIPFSYHSPDAYVDTNVRGTLNVVQAARTLGVAKVVVTSTSEVYGTARFVPMTEDHPLQGQSPYAATKIGADALAHSFYLSFATPVAIIRPFNTYGPRQSARAVIPTIITQLAQGQTTLRLGALQPSRDFNYIADTVAGFLAVAASEASVGQVINIGGSCEMTIGDTVQAIAQLMGVTPTVQTEEQRLRPTGSEVERLFASHDKATQLTGWEPRYKGREGFLQGLTETIQWFTHPSHLARYKADRYNL